MLTKWRAGNGESLHRWVTSAGEGNVMAVILEGPDGGGKTTLLKRLVKDFPDLQVMPRFATSEGGPVRQGDDLFWYARALSQKVMVEHPNALYDRHPMISEYVYRSVIPDASGRISGLAESFLSEEARVFNELIAKRSLVIFCMPPFSQVVQNLSREKQMPGVEENIQKIYNRYRERYITHAGLSLSYNYRDPSHYRLVSVVLHNYLRSAK